MSNKVNFDIDGLSELESALKDLDQASRGKVLKRAARQAMKPVYDEVKSGVESRWGERSGALHDSVKIKVTSPKKSRQWADVVATVGVFRIRGLEPLADAWYPSGYIGAANLAYWFEKGIQPHALGRRSKAARGKNTGGGMHPGIPAKPVLRPAMDNNVEIVTKRAANVLGSEIDRIAKR